MTQWPFVSIVVITYNGSDVIRPCLDTLLASDYPNYELIVLDNGSTDGVGELVKNEYPVSKYPQIRNEKVFPNRGFIRGANAGFRLAKGEIIIPFNDDTESTPNLITEMIRPLLEQKDIGIVGCKIQYPDKKTLQHAGGKILPNGLTYHIGYEQEDQGQFDTAGDVDYVTGCAMAVRRELFEAIGIYDDRYGPAYYDEVELALRARKAGFRVYYEPKALLYHIESKTHGRYSPSMLYYYNKSRMRFVLKNFNWKEILKVSWYELRWYRDISLKVYGLPLLKAYWVTLCCLPWILYDRSHRRVKID